MRHWLLTSTTYGTWLPGSARGSVTSVRERRLQDLPSTSRMEHDKPGEAWEPPMPSLERAARSQMKGPPVYLTPSQAKVLHIQFEETAIHRGWKLLAVAIMANHFHAVVAVEGDPEPSRILGDLKSYGSRKLTSDFGRPASGTWWTSQGSKRKLADQRAIESAIHYVLHKQPTPLLTWSPSEPSA